MRGDQKLGRRSFLDRCASMGAVLAAAGPMARGDEARKVKVGVIGCGSVSTQYLPHLSKCEHVQLVSTCDRIPERAERAAKQYGLSHHYPSLDAMLAGEPFELLVNLTDMQEHGHLNRQAIETGRHVWSEKPLHNSYDEAKALVELAKAKSVRIWGAPAVVTSPQFAFMARAIGEKKLGRVAAAHASYGHLGPDWSAFFYEKGGGSLPDLAVYNLSSLTGLLGPARSVVAMTSIVTPTRRVNDKGEIRVEAEDNAMVLLDHGDGVLSHIQSGFNYFDPHGHDGNQRERPSLWVTGSGGYMGLLGYDWSPHGVELATPDQPKAQVHCTDRKGYVWQEGASVIAECLATGKEPPITVEHALHVVEIIGAVRESQATGRRVELQSTFRWPVLT